MIVITRPPIPISLKTDGPAATQKLIHLISTTSTPLTSEHFERKVYSHDDVKAELIESHRHKCAFCEAKVTHVSSGHVEHFRPKAAYKQRATDKLQYPGYYWLAYDWENLLFSCEVCNSRNKGNLFPLANPNQRVQSHNGSISVETPLFINPTIDDPRLYIHFKDETPIAIHNNRRGRMTIDSLGLKRDALMEHRRTHLKILKRLWSVRNKLAAHQYNPRLHRELIKVENDLRTKTQPDEEYSAMARDYLISVGFLAK